MLGHEFFAAKMRWSKYSIRESANNSAHKYQIPRTSAICLSRVLICHFFRKWCRNKMAGRRRKNPFSEPRMSQTLLQIDGGWERERHYCRANIPLTPANTLMNLAWACNKDSYTCSAGNPWIPHVRYSGNLGFSGLYSLMVQWATFS